VHSKLFDGMGELLADIESANLIWGVVTNKPLRFAEPIMQQLGLAERSALLICPDHVKNSKPDPEPLILACKMLDLDPASVLFVGDDLRDIESGRDAGTRTAAVTTATSTRTTTPALGRRRGGRSPAGIAQGAR
jgi:phosphoglycolate phosphatase